MDVTMISNASDTPYIGKVRHKASKLPHITKPAEELPVPFSHVCIPNHLTLICQAEMISSKAFLYEALEISLNTSLKLCQCKGCIGYEMIKIEEKNIFRPLLW